MKTFDARDLNLPIDINELKPLYKTKPLIHAFNIGINWFVILSAIYLCITFFHPVLYVVTIIVVGARMHALAILMHDATHYRFLKRKKWNDLITNYTSMFLLFTSIQKYRKNHLKHHRHLNTEDDPDWFAKLGKQEFQFPKSKIEFLAKIFSYFFLIQGVKDAIWLLGRFNAPESKDDHIKIRWDVLIFAIILIEFLTLNGFWFYFLIYWIVPYFSTFFMFQYIRSVAEHFGELSYDHLLNSTRSIKTNIIERFLLAPHNVSFHLEHHLYPGVPFYNLPQLHDLLMKQKEYKSKAHITNGFWNGLMNELGNTQLQKAFQNQM